MTEKRPSHIRAHRRSNLLWLSLGFAFQEGHQGEDRVGTEGQATGSWQDRASIWMGHSNSRSLTPIALPSPPQPSPPPWVLCGLQGARDSLQ